MSRYSLITQNFKTSLNCIALYCMTLFYVGNNLHLHQITNIEPDSDRTNLNCPYNTSTLSQTNAAFPSHGSHTYVHEKRG